MTSCLLGLALTLGQPADYPKAELLIEPAALAKLDRTKVRVLDVRPRKDYEAGNVPESLHVDAAAWAAVLAIEKARRGIYNIAEPSGYLSTEKARRELGFDASVRLNAAA